MITTADIIRKKQVQALYDIRSTLSRKVKNTHNLLSPLAYSSETKLIGSVINSPDFVLSITVILEIKDCGVNKTIFEKRVLCAKTFEEDIADIVREIFVEEGFFLEATGNNNTIIANLAGPTNPTIEEEY